MSLANWIESKRRLPDSEITVLAYTPDYDDDYICFAYHSGEEWCNVFGESFGNAVEITHWMPLPDPPGLSAH